MSCEFLKSSNPADWSFLISENETSRRLRFLEQVARPLQKREWSGDETIIVSADIKYKVNEKDL